MMREEHTYLHPLQDVDTDEEPRYTDEGNALRFVARYGGKLRYVPESGWYVYDGKRWAKDETNRVMHYAREMVRGLRLEAAKEPDRARREELWNHAVRSESLRKIEAMIKLASTDDAIVCRMGDFDTDPLLFNVQNGTIDLRTKTLRPHSPADHITKLAPVDYDPEARAAVWDTFLSDVFAGDEALIAYMRRAVGYSLTGSVSEPAFFITWGGGRNGKSTLQNAVAHVLGDYAKNSPVSTFERKSFSGGATNDLAALAGARMITASENEKGRTLDISLVKRWTGGDLVTARFLNKEFFTYSPQGKVWMATNNRPHIPETSEAIWRRIKLIPFTVSFAGHEDIKMGDKLRDAAPAILAWAVEGAADWLAGGLQDPESVTAATQQYRDEENELSDFFESYCVLGRGKQVQSSVLYEAYRTWAEQNRIPWVTQTKFSPLLLELPGLGITKDKLHGGKMVFRGIGLQAEEEEAARLEQQAAITAHDDVQPSGDDTLDYGSDIPW